MSNVKQELLNLKLGIDNQLQVIAAVAKKRNKSVYSLFDDNGTLLLPSLLLAKSNVLLALTNLEKK